VFHAADCESDRGDLAGSDHKENLALSKDLTQIIVSSRLFGRWVAIDLARSRRLIRLAVPSVWRMVRWPRAKL
jgi:hypothetical protein